MMIVESLDTLPMKKLYKLHVTKSGLYLYVMYLRLFFKHTVYFRAVSFNATIIMQNLSGITFIYILHREKESAQLIG